MKYENIVEGIFIERINRFIAKVEINGQIEQVHVKNTGRCKELFIEGRRVFLQESNKANRKTKYSLISIYKGNKLINIDSQVPNAVVYESIVSKSLPEFCKLVEVKREKTYKNSRFDIYYKKENGVEGFVEIKGVTLEYDGMSMFPDAPTERGKKHIYEMIDAVKNGYEGTIFFLIQLEDVLGFKPNRETDEKFEIALNKARDNGVNILVYSSKITKESICIDKRVNY
nr:DNA/RNA nuclease SfsA [Sedimentibacter sp.]